MTDIITQKAEDLSLDGGAKSTLKRVPFGKEIRKEFSFGSKWRNLNHGSFGASPTVIRQKQREYQDLCESAPDTFIRYTYPKMLDESRAAIAKVLSAPLETIVLVVNATTGVNTALRNIVWNKDGKDEILYFNTIYGACGKTVEYVCESHHHIVNPRRIEVEYPISDADLIKHFKQAISESRAEGKTPRLAIYDTITSLPGARMPFEELTKICREEGVISLIDGAHGVGQIPIDLPALDPDYFVSNAHKWLLVPRGCAVFYSPERNHKYLRSTLPTSHGFVPLGNTKQNNPLPPTKKSAYVNNFEFVATIDNTNYLTVKDAIAWREEVCGGELAITNYTTKLAQDGGKVAAEILGTKVMENPEGTLTNCGMVNVLLPIQVGDGEGQLKWKYAMKAKDWMLETMIADHNTFVQVYGFQEEMWARFSAQIYLDIDDFEWGAKLLKKLINEVLEKGDEFWENK